MSELQISVCNNNCDELAGLHLPSNRRRRDVPNRDCKRNVSLTDSVEAYIYRGGLDSNAQSKDCLTFTSLIIQQCINDSPNAGQISRSDCGAIIEAGTRWSTTVQQDPFLVPFPVQNHSSEKDAATQFSQLPRFLPLGKAVKAAAAPGGGSCNQNTAHSWPPSELQITSRVVNPSELVGVIADSVCNYDSCSPPGEIDSGDVKVASNSVGCEVAVAVAGDVEAIARRISGNP
jgi:hypothetical protein